MNRRQLLLSSTAFGLAPLTSAAELVAGGSAGTPGSDARSRPVSAGTPGSPLPVPPTGPIPVAFLISDSAVVIDFCGPWEVFESVQAVGRRNPAFSLYTVAESTTPVVASGGMKIVPNFTFQSAPAPKVLVIPAQRGAGETALRMDSQHHAQHRCHDVRVHWERVCWRRLAS